MMGFGLIFVILIVGAIAYGLGWPERIDSGAAALDFRALQDLSFEPIDGDGHRERYPGLALAWEALRAEPGTCAVLNLSLIHISEPTRPY